MELGTFFGSSLTERRFEALDLTKGARCGLIPPMSESRRVSVVVNAEDLQALGAVLAWAGDRLEEHERSSDGEELDFVERLQQERLTAVALFGRLRAALDVPR